MLSDEYERIMANEWAQALVIPPLTFDEARRAFKKLMIRFWVNAPGASQVIKANRIVRLRRFEYRLRKGQRLNGTIIRRQVVRVHLESGWKDLIHTISHYVHNMISTERTHSPAHLYVERDMIRHAINAGWLDGALARPPRLAPSPEQVRAAKFSARLARARANLKRAATRLKRAQTLHKKHERAVRRLERGAGQ